MCGRMSRLFSSERVERQKEFMIDKVMSEFGPSYNVAPSQKVPVVIHGSRLLDVYKWGLIPFWAKDSSVGNKMINARAETLNEKLSFRESFKKKRCLILFSGFFEWDSSKNPHNVKVKGREISAFAGIWDEWMSGKNEKIRTCAVITCNSNKFMKEIHHRMPVILNPEDYGAWLNPESDLDTLNLLLKPIDSSLLEKYKVSREVNNPKNDSPELLKVVS